MTHKGFILNTLFVSTIFMACNGNKTNNNQDQNASIVTKSETKRNVIRKDIPIVTEFTYLTNIGGIDIEFEQGDYRIIAEADSALIPYIKTDFDSNLLTVTMPYDSNIDINKYDNSAIVKLYISAPTLLCVSLCGNGSFTHHGTWRQDEISLGHLSSSTFNLDSIECRSFKIENSGNGCLNFNHIKGQNLTFFTRGKKGSLTANVDCDTLYISNIGSETLNYFGTYKKKSIDNPSSKDLNDNTKMK